MRLAVTLALLATVAAPVAVFAQARTTARPAATPKATTADPALYNAPIRAADKARDAFRHPAQTLAFFQVRPDMTVVEYMPGGGWYSRILAPMLAKSGRYIAVNPDPAAMGMTADRQTAWRASTPELATKAAGYTGGAAGDAPAYTTDALPKALDGTVDRVLIVREMHNLQRMNIADSELKAMRRLLKPGGMLGIVQHRAKPTASADYTDGSKGYLRQTDVVNLVTAMGFELVSASEVNANARDTADYPGGVWTLPPAYAEKDKDRARYDAVGESDRMTLLFRKRA